MLYYLSSPNLARSLGFLTRMTQVSVLKRSGRRRTMCLALSLAGLLGFASALPARASSRCHIYGNEPRGWLVRLCIYALGL
jgi:hypothetical protein